MCVCVYMCVGVSCMCMLMLMCAHVCVCVTVYVCAHHSVVVDDGSSQALVRLHQRSPPEAARKLLLLSPSQWQALETALHRHGELFLQKVGHLQL